MPGLLNYSLTASFNDLKLDGRRIAKYVMFWLKIIHTQVTTGLDKCLFCLTTITGVFSPPAYLKPSFLTVEEGSYSES